MQNVFSTVMTAGVMLACLQALLSVLRTRKTPDRLLPMLMAVFFISFAILLLAPSGSWLRAVSGLCASWAGGAAAIRARGRRNLAAWSASNGSFLLVMLLAFGLGYQATTPFVVFHAVGMALVAAAISANVWAARSVFRAPAAILFVSALWLWMAAAAAGLAMPRLREPLAPFADTPALLLLLATGWLVMHKGFPADPGPAGGLDDEQEGANARHSLRARLAASENALAAHERVSTSAILALGAAHEFKNVLAHVKAAAQHGLELPASGQASLRLILEHAEAGRASAIGVLEQAARAAREEPRLIDAARDLGDFIRMARAAFRAQGIVLEADLPPGVVFHARMNEVEQMLLNLVGNAAGAYGEREGTHVIHLRARREAGMSTLEVRDHAGGVSPESLHRLFSTGCSSTGDTGLGLYLSKSLAAANDGMLEYEPTADGSVFRLVFGAVEGV